ncbi:MAG: MlaD family protein [Bacteriovoracaceae bacterium]|nr:MlaD family protein [Bacteriovoracaceae bacterium]
MSQFKVGLLALMALASFGIVALKITANKSMFGDFAKYRALVKDATGIYPRTAIKVAGINAGTIKDIKLQGDSALLTFDLDRSIPVTVNSYLRIKTIGFLGEKYLDIVVGPPTEKRLKENEYINVSGGAGLEDLGKDASEILAEVKDIVKMVREAIRNEKTQNLVRDILDNANDALAVVKRITTENEAKLNRIVDSVDRLTAQLAYQTDANERDSLMADLKKIGPILDDVKASSADLKIIMADVRAGKGTVGKLLRDEEVVDQVTETLSSVNTLMGRINNLQAELSVYSGYNSDQGGATEINVDLYTAPERFFRLGVATNEFGPDAAEETETTTTGTDGYKYTEKKEVDRNGFRFNLQMGRRFHQFAIRVGLIESTGGMGADYDVTSLGTRFSAEIFDFSKDSGANLRLKTDVRVWNIIYTRLSLEDILTTNRSFTVYAGLVFTDDDIAALLGLLAR